MPRDLQRLLNDLKMDITSMATLAEEAVRKAVQSLLERDSKLAMEVLDGDDEINSLEMKIDEQCLRLLALKQPMAIDLRFITSALRVNSDLERVGDLAVNIAERAIELNDRPPLPFKVELAPLADVAISMLQDSITSFIHKDPLLAREVCKRDDVADKLATELVHDLLDHMVRDAPAIRRAVSLIIIDRCLERIADLATNVGESTILYVEGKSIKHHHYTD